MTDVYCSYCDGLPPISVAQKWIVDSNEPDKYIKLLQTNDAAVDSVSEIDLNPYVLTEDEVRDYVLRRYPATKIGHANLRKYGSWWRGPYLVTAVTKVPVVYGFEKYGTRFKTSSRVRNTSRISLT